MESNNKTMSTISERIKNERSKRGLSLDKLSKLSGVSKTYLFELESGIKTNPSADVLNRIADSLAVRVNYLLLGHYEDQYDYRLIPKNLKIFALEADLRYSEVEKLLRHADITFEGNNVDLNKKNAPVEFWKGLYTTLKQQNFL